MQNGIEMNRDLVLTRIQVVELNAVFDRRFGGSFAVNPDGEFWATGALPMDVLETVKAYLEGKELPAKPVTGMLSIAVPLSGVRLADE